MVGSSYYNDTGVFGAAASVANNVVNNLFQRGVINEQKNALILQQKLSMLSNVQQEQLNEQLAQSTDANQQLQILLNAVANINIAANQTSTSGMSTQLKYGLIALGGAGVLLILILIIRKS